MCIRAKTNVINEKRSEMFNEVGARLIERQREKTEREKREEREYFNSSQI